MVQNKKAMGLAAVTVLLGLSLMGSTAFAAATGMSLSLTHKQVALDADGIKNDLSVDVSTNLRCDSTGDAGPLEISLLLIGPNGTLLSQASTEDVDPTCKGRELHQFVLTDVLAQRGIYTLVVSAEVDGIAKSITRTFDPRISGSLGPL